MTVIRRLKGLQVSDAAFDGRVCSPSIAQLVERWTVVLKLSIGRWFKSGSKEFFFFLISEYVNEVLSTWIVCCCCISVVVVVVVGN